MGKRAAAPDPAWESLPGSYVHDSYIGLLMVASYFYT